jgi:hypothetical protein
MTVGFLNQISVFGRVYDLTSISDYYDTELDENSENAVQNKTLTGEIKGLDEKKANQEDLDQTNEALANLEDEILNITPIEIEEIDDLFGLN